MLIGFTSEGAETDVRCGAAADDKHTMRLKIQYIVPLTKYVWRMSILTSELAPDDISRDILPPTSGSGFSQELSYSRFWWRKVNETFVQHRSRIVFCPSLIHKCIQPKHQRFR
jgi:hypothetical protein